MEDTALCCCSELFPENLLRVGNVLFSRLSSSRSPLGERSLGKRTGFLPAFLAKIKLVRRSILYHEKTKGESSRCFVTDCFFSSNGTGWYSLIRSASCGSSECAVSLTFEMQVSQKIGTAQSARPSWCVMEGRKTLRT